MIGALDLKTPAALHRFAHRNGGLALRPSACPHGAAVLARLARLIAIAAPTAREGPERHFREHAP